ncbi:MAG: hypothetical protein ABI242_07950, partial [Caulobacteraceae bacterium]
MALITLALSLNAGGAVAQSKTEPEAVMATISRMTEAVNRGEMPTAFAAFTASPWITDDGPPYNWHGPRAPQAWIESM